MFTKVSKLKAMQKIRITYSRNSVDYCNIRLCPSVVLICLVYIFISFASFFKSYFPLLLEQPRCKSHVNLFNNFTFLCAFYLRLSRKCHNGGHRRNIWDVQELFSIIIFVFHTDLYHNFACVTGERCTWICNLQNATIWPLWYENW